MRTRWLPASLVVPVVLSSVPGRAADIQEIVRRATAAIHSDWDAAPDYAYRERDEWTKNGQPESKVSLVVTIAGSDYYLPLAVNDQPLPPDRKASETEKLRAEVERRNRETPAGRAQRIADFRKKRDENGALLLDFPNAFQFELLREETLNGLPAYLLSATPRPRAGPLSRAAKVLSGMRGTLWIDRAQFHVIRGECEVVSPVPVYGMLARVLPGTHVVISESPVTDKVWLIGEFALTLRISKFFVFTSTQVTRSTYSQYRLNAEVLRELLGTEK